MYSSPITSQASALLRRSPSAVHRKADPLAGQVLADGLRVSAPSDPLEREAEATASRVMRMQAPAKAGRAPAGALQRACASCDGNGKKDKAIHRKPATVQRAPSAIASQGGSGSALPDGLRADMEGRFGGQDFSGVRVHAGPQANTLARSYNARAFTMGSDIYFGQGEYSPSSNGGQHLLAHELTHVVQGGGGLNTVNQPPGQEVMRFRRGDSDVIHRWPGDGLSPPGTCSWGTYLALNLAVRATKAVVDRLKKCKSTDDCILLATKILAGTAEIAARVALNTTCFKGGDTIHRDRVENRINLVVNCYEFFTKSNCPQQLLDAAAATMGAIGRAGLKVAAVVVLFALLILLAKAIAAAAAGTAVAGAVGAVLFVLVSLKDKLSSDSGPSEA